MNVKKIIKNTLTALLLVIVGLFILRCCMLSDRSVFSKPIATDALRSSFADGDGVIYKHVQTAEISDDGYLSAYKMYYDPESGEVQLAVRWNDSIYRYTSADEGCEFEFVLVNDTSGEEYPCTAVDAKKRAFYNYRRLVAEGAALSADDQVSVKMIISSSLESRQVIKYDGQKFEEYKLPRSLRRELCAE